MNATVTGVSGGSQQSVNSEEIVYTKFIEALKAGKVGIANRARPQIL